jgi:isocitrate dehydrogenase
MDVFIDFKTSDVDEILAKITKITEKNTEKTNNLELYTISTKGLKLWPYYKKINVLSDHWCLRFKLKNDSGAGLDKSIFVDLLRDFSENGIDFVSTECLYEFDGNDGFSLSQGE